MIVHGWRVELTCGVYEIVNTVNGKRYVGSAVNFKSRRRVHLHHLRQGVHHSIALQRAYDKYGENSFELRILEKCDKDIIIEREQFHMDSGYDYNCSPTAGNVMGIKRSKETRRKLSEAARAMWEDPEYREKQSESKSYMTTSSWKEMLSKRGRGERSGMFNPEKFTFCHPEHGCITETIWWFGETYGINKAHFRVMTYDNPIRKSHKGWTFKKGA